MTDIKSELATATVKIVPEVDLEAFKKAMADIPLEVLDVKAGRRNSSKDADAIRQAIALLQGVLDTDDGEDEAKANAAAEEPEQSNPEIKKLLERTKEILRRYEK